MPLPGDLTVTTITGTFLDCAGSPASGDLTIAPSAELTDATGAVVVPMTERVYQISAQGTITTDPLVSTDNATIEPQGWTYSVCLAINGVAPVSWSILLPYSAEPVDISGITPAVPQGTVTSYATSAALAAETARAEAAEALRPPDWLNVKSYGATGDGQRITGASMTASSATLTSSTPVFASGDVGKLVMVDQAGSGGVPLAATISGYTSGTQVTLSVSASTTVAGVICYWGTDDTTAVQAAVTAAGKINQSDNQYLTGNAQAVFLPWAIYMISSPVVPVSGKSFVLLGDNATIVGASSAIINFSISPGEGLVEIAGIWFEGCGGHIMENISIHGTVSIHDCNAVLRNPGYSLFWMDDVARADGHITSLYQAVFRNISWWLGPGTRSVEAWHMVSTGGAELTDIHFVNLNGPNPTGTTPAGMDNTQYQFYIGCTSGSYSTNISWRDCLAASLYGGYIKIDDAKNVTIDGLNVYNTYVESNPNDLIAFATNATGGNGCHGVTVRNVSVNNALGTGTPPPPYHISFTSACSGILVENCVGGWSSNGLTINNGGATGAVYLNNPVSQSGYPVINNKAADTIVASAGAVASETLAVSGSLSTALATVTQSGTGKILQLTGPASPSGEALAYSLAGDTNDRFYLSPGGHSLFFGSGSATQDVQLYRPSAGVLSVQATSAPTSVTLNVTAPSVQTSTVPLSQLICHSSGDLAQTAQVSGDTVPRFEVDSNGKHQWGAGGSSAVDTGLYRTSAGVLKTDNSLTVGTGLAVTGTTILTGEVTVPNGTVSTDAAAFGQIPLIDTTAGDFQAAGTQSAGVSGKTAAADHVHPGGPWIPADVSLLAAVCDPLLASGTSGTVAGVVYLIKIPIRQAMTVSNTVWGVSSAGSGTSTETFTGLYSSSGTLLSGSSDVSSSLTSTGLRACALTTPQALAAGTFVWASLLVNFGTTQPTLLRLPATTTIGNFGYTTASVLRFANYPTGSQTALPSPITPSSNGTSLAFPWWAGLS